MKQNLIGIAVKMRLKDRFDYRFINKKLLPRGPENQLNFFEIIFRSTGLRLLLKLSVKIYFLYI